MDDKKSVLNIEEITIGEHPPELTIKFSEPISLIDLNKIILRDIVVPNTVKGFKIRGI